MNPADIGFTLEAMRFPIEALGYDIVSELPVFSIFDRGRVKEEKALMAKAEQLGAILPGRWSKIDASLKSQSAT